MKAAGQLFDDLGFQNLGGMADNQLLQYGVGKLLEGGGQAIENNVSNPESSNFLGCSIDPLILSSLVFNRSTNTSRSILSSTTSTSTLST
jgi:hypothetical protein